MTTSRQNQRKFIQKSWWTLVKQEFDFEICPEIDVTIIFNEYQSHRKYRRHSIQILKNKCCQRLDSNDTWKNQINNVQIYVISSDIDTDIDRRTIHQAKSNEVINKNSARDSIQWKHQTGLQLQSARILTLIRSVSDSVNPYLRFFEKRPPSRYKSRSLFEDKRQLPYS